MTEAEDREARLALEPMRPATPPAHFFKGATESLKQIWDRRSLLSRLVKREIRARYKDSVLGLIWSLVRPLVNLLIYYLAIGRVLGAERSIPDFAIYVFTGLTVWQLFSECLMGVTGSIVGNSGIIKKIQLPREIFPLSAVGGALFNFAMQFGILIVAAVVIRGIIPDERLIYIPLSILVALVWVLAFGLVLSAANVYLRDVQYLVEVTLMVGMWASPIVYSWEMIASRGPSWFSEVYVANPVTLSVLGFQRAIWTAGANEPVVSHLAFRLLVAFLIGCVALVISQRFFAIMQRDFAQEL